VKIGLHTATPERKYDFFVTLGVASRRLAAIFGTLTKYSFAICCSIFTAFGSFLEEETRF